MQTPFISSKGAAKSVLALAVMAICGAILWQQIAAIPTEELLATFRAIAPWQWGLASVATLCSFMAVGRYDAVWHKRFGTDVPDAKARRTGMAAIAIGQTIGAGTVTGAFVRWHLLPGLGFKTTTAITVGVSLSFLTCWAVLGLGAAVWIGILPLMPVLWGITICAALAPFLATRFTARIAMYRKDAGRLLKLSALDMGFAGLALWALVPDASLSLLAPVVAAYIVALGAGLISNAPGGLGAFDLCLLAFIPTITEADALAAILAFRVVYYLIPAIAAGAYLAVVHWNRSRTTGTTDAPISDLCRQGAQLKQVGAKDWVVRKHLLGTVAIEPSGRDADLTGWLSKVGGFRALYKADSHLAAKARQRGWAVRRIADDAVIDLQTWTAEGSKMRQLRRKIAQATKAGVQIIPAQGPLPTRDMAQVAQRWAQHHGGELGYSMGRYCPDYIGQQRVYLIWDGPKLCGFITVQTRQQTWSIDVIRHLPDMPNGAIHAAYAAVIADAKTSGAKILSLGAVPTADTVCKHQLKFRSAKAGLVQFKQSFAPTWRPLYHVAPTRLQWIVSIAHVVWHVQRPLPRTFGRLSRTVKSLIMISEIFHLNRADPRDIRP